MSRHCRASFARCRCSSRPKSRQPALLTGLWFRSPRRLFPKDFVQLGQGLSQPTFRRCPSCESRTVSPDTSSLHRAANEPAASPTCTGTLLPERTRFRFVLSFDRDETPIHTSPPRKLYLG